MKTPNENHLQFVGGGLGVYKMSTKLKIRELQNQLKLIKEEIDQFEQDEKTPNEQYQDDIDEVIQDYKLAISNATIYYENRKKEVKQQIRERYEAEIDYTVEELYKRYQYRLDIIEEKFKDLIDKMRNEFYQTKHKTPEPKYETIEFDIQEEI